MLSIVASKAEVANPKLVEKQRAPKEDNLTWLGGMEIPADRVELLLVGGAGPLHFRVRVAQAHARHDLSPSYWSHIALVEPRRSPLASTPIREVSLDPPRGFGFAPRDNAIQVDELDRYRDPTLYPNIASIRVPASWGTIATHLDRLQKQRSAVDLPELVLSWLAFAWGAGKVGNPLLEGRGVPSAVLAETVLGASGVNLSPGAVQGASCPELVWQSAKWWQEFYAESGGDVLSGSYFTPHALVETT
ncbi:MAG TPA: hypothetical protein VIM73_13190 [Polyangiaceae bacterium]